MDEKKMTISEVCERLGNGEIGVMPSDTIYALAASALNQKAVARVHKARKRDSDKALIVMVDSVDDLARFGVRPDEKVGRILEKVWPGAVSVILPIAQKRKIKDLEYLHCGQETLAFRLPDSDFMREILRKTGPLVVPSANLQGQKTAEDITQAREQFGDRVDFYFDGGTLVGEPSTLIRIINNGEVEVLRKGRVAEFRISNF